MAKQPRATLKTWFETADKPTQQQFWDWLDSYFHKDDLIPAASIDGLGTIPDQAEIDALSALVTPVEIVLSGSGTYLLPLKRLLVAITFIGSGNFKVGTSSGGEQIVPEIAVTTKETFTVMWIELANTTLYFTGTGTVILHF